MLDVHATQSARLGCGKASAIADVDLLAAFFATADPDRSIEWAATLIERLGSMNSVLGAQPTTIASIIADQQCQMLVAILRSTIAAASRAELSKAPILSNGDALARYLQASLAGKPSEQVNVMWLDGRQRLIAEDEMFNGTVDASSIHIREVVRRALERNATGAILIHNHPSGDPSPSKADIEMTRTLARALSPVNVTLLDHLITATEGVVSMRHLGYM